MKIQNLKKIKLPDSPGIYIFKKNKDNIYIGKATSLKDRVRSYFSKDLIETRGPLLVDMLFQANKVEFIKTDSVLEALILEAEMIKKYQPKYNTKEKSDKSFNYVCITDEKIPKVLVERDKNLKPKNYNPKAIYGPFTNGNQLKEAMKIIRPIFPYLDKESLKRGNTFFYKQLGLSPELNSKENEEGYKKNINNLKLFFQGKKKRILLNLKKDMMTLAKKKEFEKANEIKKKIFALTHINDVALIKENTTQIYQNFRVLPASGLRHDSNFNKSASFRVEAYDIAHMSGKNMVGVMTVVDVPAQAGDGEVNKNEYKKFKIRTQSGTNDTGALTEILERRFVHTEWQYPRLIVVDGSIAQINTARKVMNKIGIDIPIVAVVKNDRHKPIGIKGDAVFAKKYEKDILLANSEAHRFAIAYHKKMRSKSFLK